MSTSVAAVASTALTRQQQRIDRLDRLDGIARALVMASRVLLAVLVALVLLHR